MIRTLRFQNYRVLRDAELRLQPFTLLVGPNGSGKSTVMHALKTLRALAQGYLPNSAPLASLGADPASVRLVVEWGDSSTQTIASTTVAGEYLHLTERSQRIAAHSNGPLGRVLRDLQVYSLDERAIIKPVRLSPETRLGEDGEDLRAW